VGVAYQDEENNPIPTEVEVISVLPHGRQIGLAQGDRLIRYNGEVLTSREQLMALINTRGGHSRTLVVRRDATILYFEVQPGGIGVTIRTVKAEPAAKTGSIRLQFIQRRAPAFDESIRQLSIYQNAFLAPPTTVSTIERARFVR
jgi:PDZ domain